MSNNIILIISILACAFSFGSVSAATYYVDPNGSDDANGLSWATAFETIQKAIDAASNNDIVDVNAGTYYESIDFSGKAVSVRSLDPNDPQVVAETLIDGNNTDKVIVFDDSENANSIMIGFTVKGGGTGIYCFEASPAIYSCVIRDNNDSGIVNLKLSEPNIINCVFYSNSAKYGAGIRNFQSSPKITNCIFSQNAASSRGGGIYNSFSSPTITNCTFSSNTASTSAGGMFSSISSAVVKNSVFWDNSAGYLGNEIYNDNSDPNFSYCDIEGCGGSSSWDPNFGTYDGGNIDSAPWFLNTNNPLGSDNIFYTVDDGLRLKSSSSCIDAADGNPAPSVDITGQSRVDISGVGTGIGDPNYVDIGAYEFSGDSDNDGMPDDWENYYGLDPNTNDADNDLDWDGHSNLSEYLHSSHPNDISIEPSVNITINVPNDINTIQRAINTSIDGDTVIVSSGTYYETIDFNGVACSLTSTDPNDPCVVASTIIDANDPDQNVALFQSGEDLNSVLEGLTITGGKHGIFCTNGSSPKIVKCDIKENQNSGISITDNGSSPEITNCTIAANEGYGIWCDSYGSVSVSDCTISNNKNYGVRCYSHVDATLEGCNIAGNGGGLWGGVYCYFSEATLKNCVIEDNSGHGIYIVSYVELTMEDCNIVGNGQGLSHYGVYIDEWSEATVKRCIIRQNKGPGVYLLQGSDGTLENCIISSNGSTGITIYNKPLYPALWADYVKVVNCTVFGNSNYGIYGPAAEVKNCIVWNHNNNDLYDCTASYSCIEDGDSGWGNISADPQFKGVDNNDFHLQSWSRCIDAGDPCSDWSNEPDYDNGHINMGAYGNTAGAATVTYADEDDLPDEWELHYFGGDDPNLVDPDGDPDEDGFTNWVEYLFGYDPNDPNTGTSASLGLIAFISGSQIDPFNNEPITVSYVVNMKADVNVSFFGTETSEQVRLLSQPNAIPGDVNDVTWDGTDTSGLIVERCFYDVKIDANDNDGNSASWTFAGSGDTSPGVTTPVLDKTNFEVHQNIPAVVTCNMTDWGTRGIDIVKDNGKDASWFHNNPDKGRICHLSKDKLLKPGDNVFYWNGRWGADVNDPKAGPNQNVCQEPWRVFYDYVVSVKRGAIVVYYDDLISNLRCNPYRMIPKYGEVTTISYDLAYDADVTIDIYNPNGIHFCTISRQQKAGTRDVTWYGTDGDPNDPNSGYISTEGLYRIELDVDDTVENEKVVGSMTAYR